MHPKKNVRFARLGIVFTFVLMLSACNLPGTLPQNVDDIVAQTLTAMSAQSVTPTLEAPATTDAAGTEIPTPMTPPENTTAPVVHVIIPGEMQAIESTVDDLLYNGDDFSINLFERPFTQTLMENRFDLDLQKIAMSTDNTFFYFSLDLKDVNLNTKTLDGNYGIELDLDKNGRGDYLLWAYQPPTTTSWDYLGVVLFSDQNEDVGGTRALVSDAVKPEWNGYETEVWPSKPLTDPDGAWARISPKDATVVQLAVKRSLVGNPASFLWSAWTDDQIKASYKFEYNDFYTAAEAGSPYAANPNYPLKALSQMDSTCREAWGFKPTGNEPGICKKAVVQATAKPKTTTKPGVTPTITPLVPTKQVITATPCDLAQVEASMLAWNPVWASSISICLSGNGCKNPDASGYLNWLVPPGAYTITASQAVYRVLPESVSFTVDCNNTAHIDYSIDIP